jgi:hypothetical protein
MTHDPMYTERGIAAFRCFRFSSGHLHSLVMGSTWEAGVLKADAIPERENMSGLWGFKTLPEAIYQEGGSDDLVFALTEHWGKMVEHETGLRSQNALIVAFIEPVRPAALKVFPRKDLARNYPDVPVIHQREIAAKIEELGMVTLPKAAPYPLMQWLGPDGELVWAPETVGPPASVANAAQYEMLPAAASYPDETHPADQRLRKVRFEDSSGDRFVFWTLVGEDSMGVPMTGLYPPQSGEMYRHRIED